MSHLQRLRRGQFGVLFVLVGLGGTACQSSAPATVVTGAGVPWQSADAYVQRVETVDGACYVLVKKNGDLALSLSCVRIERD